MRVTHWVLIPMQDFAGQIELKNKTKKPQKTKSRTLLTSYLVVLRPAPLWRHGQRVGAQQTPVSPIGLAKRRLHPIHTRLRGRKQTHTHSTHRVRQKSNRKTTRRFIQRWRVRMTAGFSGCSYFTWGMPEAGGCQVAVTTSVQVSSAAKTQTKFRFETSRRRQERRRSGAFQYQHHPTVLYAEKRFSMSQIQCVRSTRMSYCIFDIILITEQILPSASSSLFSVISKLLYVN